MLCNSEETMKSEQIYLTTPDKVKEAISLIYDLEIGNKYKVTISNAGTKTNRQRGYQWRLYEDIAKSGQGDSSDPDEIDVKCKWKFARPILCREDDFFRDLLEEYIKRYGGDPERMRWFCRNMIHTEKFEPPLMAEYIQAIINFFAPQGVALSDPAEYGLK